MHTCCVLKPNICHALMFKDILPNCALLLVHRCTYMYMDVHTAGGEGGERRGGGRRGERGGNKI